jgi:hypothetical protein
VPRTRTLRTLASGLAVAALAGCSAAGAEEALPFEAYKAVIVAHEDAIADCMRSEGFQYVAHLPSDVLLEEAATLAEHEGRDPIAAVETVHLPPDPNSEFVRAMSGAEQGAWYDAYWGDEGTGEPGCYYGTYEEIWGIDPFEVDEEQNRTVERMYGDPRLLRAEQDYVACMYDAGYDVHGIDDVFRLLEEAGLQGGPDSRASPDPFRLEALASHDHCREPYDDVYDALHAEYFDYSYDHP